MKKNLIVGAALVLLFMASAPCWAWNLEGQWVANQMGARLEAVIEQAGNEISGVAYLHNPSGKVDTYHFKGVIQGNKVKAGHYSGHTFSGQILDENNLKGVVRTKKGYKVSVLAKRHQ